jgi:alpha-aminoadipic semialdehyde synthase
LTAATIAQKGQLQPAHTKLYQTLSKVKIREEKKVLILGSGYVAGPVVDYFAQQPNLSVTIASNNIAEAENLIKQKTKTVATLINIQDRQQLSSLVSKHDIIIRYLFYYKNLKKIDLKNLSVWCLPACIPS